MDREALCEEALTLTPEDVCAEFIALSVVEHSYTPGLSITVRVAGVHGEVSDDGRGMRLTSDVGDTVSHAERALTSEYPCLPAAVPVESVLDELVWGKRGSLGPALANSACRSLEFVSERDGELWLQQYRGGEPLDRPTNLRPTDRTGTTIRFETGSEIAVETVATLIDALMLRIPGLTIDGPGSPDSR